MKLCIQCGKKPNHAKNLCIKCYDIKRGEYYKSIAELIKCQCSPDCPEMIYNLTDRGKPKKYALGHRAKGNIAVNWKGGRKITPDKYIHIFKKNLHPFTNKAGYVPEHRLVLEEWYSDLLGIPIYLDPKKYAVHHKDGNTKNNNLQNLQLMTHNEHARITYTKDMSNRVCLTCGTNQTYSNKKGRKRWFKHIFIEGEWLCNNCYQNIRNKLNGRY